MEKCTSLLTTKHFKQVDSVPTKTLQSKKKRKKGSFRKLRSKFFPHEYKNYMQ